MDIKEILPHIPKMVEHSPGHWGFPEAINYDENYGILFEMVSVDVKTHKVYKTGDIGCLTECRSVGDWAVEFSNQKNFTDKDKLIKHVNKMYKKMLVCIEECKKNYIEKRKQQIENDFVK